MEKMYERDAASGDEFVDDLFMKVTIDEELLDRILHLALAAIKYRVYKICEFNYKPEWYEYELDEDCEAQLGNRVDYDICMMSVTERMVKWEMHRRDLDSPIYHVSGPINLEDLARDFGYGEIFEGAKNELK